LDRLNVIDFSGSEKTADKGEADATDIRILDVIDFTDRGGGRGELTSIDLSSALRD